MKSLVIFLDNHVLVSIQNFFPGNWLATDVLDQYAKKYGFDRKRLSYGTCDALEIQEVMK